ncbi:LacI family DNA-binding transcriptional regulator [Secundilactobacillus collinoides]|nr:LacI family DNA-binding transcriptional regulator [Secundilactobacillus collinoides]
MLKKKRVTISEIAKLAGVSTATVSRFINGHYEKKWHLRRVRKFKK